MNCYILQIIIIILIFVILYFFQKYEDKKNNKINNFYNNIKLPLFVAALVGFILNLNILNYNNDNNVFIKSNENLIKSDINQEIYTDYANF